MTSQITRSRLGADCQGPSGDCSKSPGELRFRYKPKEVGVAPSTENRVSRYDCGFVKALPSSSQGQSQEYSQGVRVFDCKSHYNSAPISTSPRSSELFHSSSVPAPLYYNYLQQAKIQALRSESHYESQVVLNQEAIKELQWWAENLMAWNGRALAQPDPSIIIESDASREGWGAHCNGLSTGCLWSQSEQFLHINCLELLAGSFAIKCFAKDKTNIDIQLFMEM